MKKLVILENNLGGYGKQFRDWIKTRFSSDIKVIFFAGVSGLGEGLYDENQNIIDGEFDKLWCQFIHEG